MIPRLRHVVERRLLPVVIERMRDEPVILLQGPRTVGKSTLLREIARRVGAEVLDLDDLATRQAMAADPATLVAGPATVCIDEYQHVPAVLDAIKAELNRDGRPGRFVLTGSTRHDMLPVAAQALTGRLHGRAVHPLSQGEIDEAHEHLLADMLSNKAGVATGPPSTTTREGYIERVVAGGFPTPLSRATAVARRRWFDDYIRLTLERDVRELSRIQRAAALPRLLERLAGQTGQVLNIARAGSAISLNERTADSYLRLLEAVFLVYRLPAWGTTLTSRSAATPKIHVVDSGVAARLLRLTSEKLARRNASALTELGHLLETFVVGELAKQASWLDGIAGLGHWRTRDGVEVDLVIELDSGLIVAFEIKASQRIGTLETGPLRKLRDAVGASFLAGYVLHLGQQSFTVADRIHALPVDRLWSPRESRPA